MKLQRYNQFINEGIISKGLELLNYKTVKENDKIAQKYIKMIYDNYNKHKNVMAAKIIINSGYTTLWYKISDDPYAQAGTSGGEYPNFIEVKLTTIQELGWANDITRARIEIEKNGKKLVGRDMKTNEVIYDENGIKEDVYDYINISQAQVDKLISFFKSEYIKKYPEMSVFKAFNSHRVLEIDQNLRNLLINRSKESRNKHEQNRKELENKFLEYVDVYAKFTQEDIQDYFIDLIDYLQDTILNENPYIGIGTIIDNKFVYNCKKLNSTTLKDGLFYHNDLKKIDISIKPNKIYYTLDFSLPLFNYENISGGTIDYNKVKSFLKKEYNLSTDKYNSNGSFKLIYVGSEDPIIKSYIQKGRLRIDKIQLHIILEQN
jgi:hypothetical protein